MEEKANKKSYTGYIIIAVAIVLAAIIVPIAWQLGGKLANKEAEPKPNNNVVENTTNNNVVENTTNKISLIERNSLSDDIVQGEDYYIYLVDSNEVITSHGYSSANYEKIGDKEYVVAKYGAYISFSIDIIDYKTGNVVKHYEDGVGYRIENNEIVVYSFKDAVDKKYIKEVEEADTPYMVSNDPTFKF